MSPMVVFCENVIHIFVLSMVKSPETALGTFNVHERWLPVWKITFCLIALLAVAGCGSTIGEMTPRSPALSSFDLGHNVVIGTTAKKGPLSRDATAEEWVESLSAAIDARIGRYNKGDLYHLGVSIDQFVLAAPGVPLFLSPKSILQVSVTVWDNAKAQKINETPKQILVFENFSGASLLGSGITRSREEQMAGLSANAAIKIENWLIENAAWFAPSNDAE